MPDSGLFFRPGVLVLDCFRAWFSDLAFSPVSLEGLFTDLVCLNSSTGYIPSRPQDIYKYYNISWLL